MRDHTVHDVELGDVLNICGQTFIAAEVILTKDQPARLIMKQPIELLEN